MLSQLLLACKAHNPALQIAGNLLRGRTRAMPPECWPAKFLLRVPQIAQEADP